MKKPDLEVEVLFSSLSKFYQAVVDPARTLTLDDRIDDIFYDSLDFVEAQLAVEMELDFNLDDFCFDNDGTKTIRDFLTEIVNHENPKRNI